MLAAVGGVVARHRRGVVALAILLLALLVVTLLVQRHGKASARPDPRPLDLTKFVLGSRPSVPVTPELRERLTRQLRARVDAVDCARELRAAERDRRIDRVEAERVERFCGGL